MIPSFRSQENTLNSCTSFTRNNNVARCQRHWDVSMKYWVQTWKNHVCKFCMWQSILCTCTS